MIIAINAKIVPIIFFQVKNSVFKNILERITTQTALVTTIILASLAAVNISPKR